MYSHLASANNKTEDSHGDYGEVNWNKYILLFRYGAVEMKRDFYVERKVSICVSGKIVIVYSFTNFSSEDFEKKIEKWVKFNKINNL